MPGQTIHSCRVADCLKSKAWRIYECRHNTSTDKFHRINLNHQNKSCFKTLNCWSKAKQDQNILIKHVYFCFVYIYTFYWQSYSLCLKTLKQQVSFQSKSEPISIDLKFLGVWVRPPCVSGQEFQQVVCRLEFQSAASKFLNNYFGCILFNFSPVCIFSKKDVCGVEFQSAGSKFLPN